MILSAQSIRKQCTKHGMISPFIEKQVINGKTAGLSACSYDCRIKQNVTLIPIRHSNTGLTHDMESGLTYHDPLSKTSSVLASTIEQFNIPDDVCGFVVDKSSYARVFMTAFNTLLDPGWSGFLTLELVNLGDEIIYLKAGDPVCQIVFHWLDQPTDLPYKGKYNFQKDEPVEAIYEK